MNYGKVEGRSSSRSRSPSTARRAATSAILTDILSRLDRAPTLRTVDARPGKSILIVPGRLIGRRTDSAALRHMQLQQGCAGKEKLSRIVFRAYSADRASDWK